MTSNNLDQLAMDAINEYLELAEYAIKTSRQEGSDSCYGNAVLLLLSSVLDAIGSYYSYCKKDKKTRKTIDNKKGRFVSFQSLPDFEDRKNVREHFKQVYKHYIHNQNDNCGYTSETMFINDFYHNLRCGVTHNAVFSDGKVVMYSNTDHSNKTLNINDLFKMVKRVSDDFFTKNASTFTFNDNPNEPETGYTPSNNVSQN